MTTVKEIQSWIDKNQTHLKDYTTQEIANLAIAAGLDRIAVAQWQTQVAFKAAI